jgi:hypothetical protein
MQECLSACHSGASLVVTWLPFRWNVRVQEACHTVSAQLAVCVRTIFYATITILDFDLVSTRVLGGRDQSKNDVSTVSWPEGTEGWLPYNWRVPLLHPSCFPVYGVLWNEIVVRTSEYEHVELVQTPVLHAKMVPWQLRRQSCCRTG